MLKFLIDRLKEPSTWIGLTTLLTTAGVTLAPELTSAIVTAGVAVGGMIAVLVKEKA